MSFDVIPDEHVGIAPAVVSEPKGSYRVAHAGARTDLGVAVVAEGTTNVTPDGRDSVCWVTGTSSGDTGVRPLFIIGGDDGVAVLDAPSMPASVSGGGWVDVSFGAVAQ